MQGMGKTQKAGDGQNTNWKKTAKQKTEEDNVTKQRESKTEYQSRDL